MTQTLNERAGHEQEASQEAAKPRGVGRAIIAEQESSGQRVSAWCRQRHVQEQSFYQWRKRLRSMPEEKPGSFIQIEAAGGMTKVVSIHTPEGYRVEVPPGTAGAYVRTLLEVIP